MRDAEVDEARLFAAGDDIDGVTERLASAREKARAILRLAKRVRAGGPHGSGGKLAHPLTETRETGERPLGRLGREISLGVEPFGEANALAQAIEDVNAPFVETRDHEVKAIRTEVDGGDRRRGGLACA